MITFENVAFRYGAAPLFEGVTQQLETGGFYFLTGPSGAGKTTFLKLCFGALKAASGSVSAFGAPYANMARDDLAHTRRRIGMVHQDCQFLDHLSVAENVALPYTVAARDDYLPALTDLLRWVGLSQQADLLPPQLSGGERQRAALARAVIMSPDVILADEPTGNIDWEMSERLLQLLTDLNASGKTIVVATHDMALIRQAKAAVQARVLRLKGGGLVQAGADL